MNKEPKKKCYVCLKELGWGKITLNPTNKLKKRYICLSTKEKNLCNKILWELATWGNCNKSCCATYHMNRFDLDQQIKEIKQGRYIYQYTD